MRSATLISLFDVVRATTVGMMLYCSPVWWGFARVQEREALEGIIRRLVRQGTYLHLLPHLRLSAAMRILDSLPVFCTILVMYCINCCRRSSNRATPCDHGPITVSFPCLTTCLRNASLPGCYTNKLCFP